MKLIIKQYLASLKERDELDAILPGLLSQLGLTVFSRPQKGTRQDGVDVAAVGRINGGVEKVYLFTIKAGDLTRSNWDTEGPQSVRPSLNEILDSYIPNRLPDEHKDKDIVICICLGGDVQEQVRSSVEGYIRKNKRSNLTFEEWNGDKIATLILSNFLREDLLPPDSRAELRKALALLDEPDASYRHFGNLIRLLSTRKDIKVKDRLMILRQINICLWILFAWARDANNLEAAYLAAELALLHAWELAKEYTAEATKSAVEIQLAFQSIVVLYLQVISQYNQKIVSHVTTRHALSFAVRSTSSLDVNLKLFDILGRLAMNGIWAYWRLLQADDNAEAHEVALQGIQATSFAIKQLIWNNRTLLLPAKDDQVIDISIAVMLLILDTANHNEIVKWLHEIVSRAVFAIQAQSKYPCILSNYSELLEHPDSSNPEYFKKVTSGSILYPMIALWAALLEKPNLYRRVQKLKEEHLRHCNFQLWYPDETSEQHIYIDSTVHHGATLSHVCVDRSMREFFQQVFGECENSPYFETLSAVKYNLWPLILVACRHHRIPLPVHLWKKAEQPEDEKIDQS